MGAGRTETPQVRRGSGLGGSGSRREGGPGRCPEIAAAKESSDSILTQFRNCAAPAGRPARGAGDAAAAPGARSPEPGGRPRRAAPARLVPRAARPAPDGGPGALSAHLPAALGERGRPRRGCGSVRGAGSDAAGGSRPLAPPPPPPPRVGRASEAGRGAGRRARCGHRRARQRTWRPAGSRGRRLGGGPGWGPAGRRRLRPWAVPRAARARGAVRGRPPRPALGLQPPLRSPARASPVRRSAGAGGRPCNGTGTPALHCGSFGSGGSAAGPLTPRAPLAWPRRRWARLTPGPEA